MSSLVATDTLLTPTFTANSSWLSALGLEEYVAIDLETTGLDPRSDSIIEIGAVRFRHGLETDSFRTFLRINGTLNPFITELTGITDADLRSAPDFDDVAAEFYDFLGNVPLVGQNIDFDLGFISAAGRKMESLTAAYDVHRIAVVDTCMLARIFWPELPRFSLGSLASEFGIELASAHRAEEDARATGRVLASIIEQLPPRVWGTLAGELNRLMSLTTHRSRFFFRQLADIAQSIPTPKPNRDVASEFSQETTPNYDFQACLGKNGCFEKTLHSFRARSMQLDMAEKAHHAFSDSTITLIEAPTGTGKSLAYLIPALNWACDCPDESRQIIVSSHTRALQEQLFRKDIREIEMATGAPVRAAVLKGRNNYLCRRRLRQVLNEAAERLSELECIRILSLLRWAELTTTGDISEINGFDSSGDSYLWSLVCSDAQACAGSACGSSKGDFHRVAQERANVSRIVFVNHALLMSDPSRFLIGDAPNRKLVIDEAHQFERAVVSAMTEELSSAVVRNALLRLADERGSRGLIPRLEKAVRDANSDTSKKLADAAELTRSLFSIVRSTFSALAESVTAWQRDMSRTAKLRFRGGDALHSAIRLPLQQLRISWPDLVASIETLMQDLSQLKGEERIAPDLLLELRSVNELIADIERIIELFCNAEDSGCVFWAEAGQGRSNNWCALYSAPIAINELLEREFWPRVDSAVLTSATLTTGQSFSHFIETMGLTEMDSDRLISCTLESPFNMDKQARVFVPLYLSDPKQREHIQEVSRLCCNLVESVRRGTLILCTSLDAVKQISSALDPIARRTGRTLLVQQSASSAPELLKRLRKENDAILVGAASFWEGIDVVGEALQILVIVKLPFDVPIEPWIEARGEYLARQGKDPFREFSVPEATLRLKQGLGRLIRHANDRGIAIIADPRMERTQFGRTIRGSLQTVPRSVASEEILMQEVCEFFATVEA